MLDTVGHQTEGADFASIHTEALNAIRLPEGARITIHMVHVNHLDLTWYWRLPDTIEMCLETIRWNVEMLEQHPDATYTHTQVFTLKVVEQVDRPLLDRFAKLVKEGRIEIDSGQIVEPDHNMPSGESLARQFLYGQTYIRSRFGVQAQTLVNSDSFGHTRSLPQVLQLSGIGHMIFKRPREKYVHLPETPFVWRGIDGAEVYALRFINKGSGLPSLSQDYVLPENSNPLQEKIDRNLAAGVHHFFGTHCISDSGGSAPYVAPASGQGYELRYDTPGGFWKAVKSENHDLPVVDGLFNYVYQGCYTTHIEEKEHCRRAERELRHLELLWTIASLQGHGYPLDSITTLWERCCLLQFHDVLPGTGSPEAHRDNAALYSELFLDANVLRRKAQLLLDANCPAGPGARSFLVANSRPRACSGVVAADVELPISRDRRDGIYIGDSGVIVDGDGNRTNYQLVDRRAYQRYIRGTAIFVANGVQPIALKPLYLLNEPPSASGVSADGCVLENEHLRVEVGGEGIIRSMRTKPDGRERLKSDAPVRIELWPETDYLGDYSSEMKAWMLGVTDARSAASPVGEPGVVENGPVRATIRVRHAWGQSTFTTDVSLYDGQDWVEMRIEMDWQEKEVLARMCVEPALAGEIHRSYGIPLGTELADGTELEVPVIGWADMSDSASGVALLSIDRPGHTFRDDAIRVSLVRCATGDHDPRTDSGIVRTTLRLLPHDGSAEDAGVPGRSDEFSHPMLAWQCEPSHIGGTPPPSPITLDADGVVMSGLKLAQNGQGYLLRVYESLGRQSHGTLKLDGPLADCEVFESNILEDEAKPVGRGSIGLDFRPWEIKCVLVKLDGPVRQLEPGFTGSFFTP